MLACATRSFSVLFKSSTSKPLRPASGEAMWWIQFPNKEDRTFYADLNGKFTGKKWLPQGCCLCMFADSLVPPGADRHLGWSDHKRAILNTGVNAPKTRSAAFYSPNTHKNTLKTSLIYVCVGLLTKKTNVLITGCSSVKREFCVQQTTLELRQIHFGRKVIHAYKF